MANKLTVTLETVTPLFLGGVEPHGKPELRAPSVRGALRYWLRAALGVNTNLDSLKTAEANVFGDTSEGSTIAVRAHSNAQPVKFFSSRQREARDTKYLFFSLDGNQDADARECFSQGEKVEIQLISRRQDVEVWTHACGAFWLLTRLGGLGARARRGAGGLQFMDDTMPVNWPDKSLPPLAVRAKTRLELINELANDLTNLRAAMGVERSRAATLPTPFDILAPGACQIWVLAPENGMWPSWSLALKNVGQALRQARSLPSPKQLNAIRKAKAGSTQLPDIDRAALGLPIVFHDVQTNENVGTLEGDGQIEFGRRASPLHIRVVKLASSSPSYAVILTWFNASFAPTGSQLVLKSEKASVSGNLPDPSWMGTSFWPTFDAKSGATRAEVEFE